MMCDMSILAQLSYQVGDRSEATSKAAAEQAYPLLQEALTAWDGKQAGHALKGLVHVARALPGERKALLAIAVEYALSGRAVVRQTAKALHKAVRETRK